ncbi:GntR family transcriptional regulator [Nocardia sp. NBC_00881]|uniref:GntR family transcriptional regulator n=1 Tax=Nocardia sp. NBC_00881 TaxID=2975995 RepID=UPI00386A2959|nr:GntR family transcriptional regulator [Nocardia sp. NBC_00881]
MVTPLPRPSSRVRTSNSELLSDRAYVAIRDKLISLDIAPGDTIDEERLAAELGVGRTPVREAIKRLAHQKLVVIYPRRGSYASEIDVADLESICDIRERLEGLAAEQAARHARYEERQELQHLLAEFNGCTEPTALLELDTAMHRTVHRLAHNEYLRDILMQSLDLSLRIWNMARERLPHLEHHVHSQAEVLRAILDRDPQRAGELAQRHVREFEDEVREMF